MSWAPAWAQNAIVVENQNPGTPPATWYVDGPGDANIQGFATDMSVNRGDTVHFKIDTDASAYHIDIYRLGWYQGNGARLAGAGVITATLPQLQPPGIYEPSTAMTDCGNWAESAHWAVPLNAVSGVYVAKLTRDDSAPGTSHITFVVRNDANTSDIVMQTSDATWQAYNVYGGASTYPALGGHAPGYNHATKVSYNRPFDIRHASGGPGDNLFAAEYPMIRWLEANGYDVTYICSLDTDRRGSTLLQNRLFLSVGHDEYWSGPQRANVTAARDAGVHLAFFSGNEIYWRTRYEPSIDGSVTPYRTLVCFKEGTLGENGCGGKCDPSAEWTGLWRDGCAPNYAPTDACAPENTLSGQISWDGSIGAIQVPDAYKNLRFWRNTSIAALGAGQTATLGQETLGSEWDYEQFGGHYPARRIKLSRTLLAGKTHHLSLYRADSGALVFGAGTIQWSWGLDAFHTHNQVPVNADMRQATVNLFADMGVAPATLQPGLVPATASSDTQAPACTITSPLHGSTMSQNSTVVIQGTAVDSGGGTVAGVEVSVDGGATWSAATGAASWTFAWAPSGQGPFTIKSRAFDDTCNLEAAGAVGSPNVISLTVTAPVCPCTVFPPSEVPPNPLANDGSPISLGMKFRTDVDGTITALRYYKPAGATGTHTGNLWSAGGANLAQQVFTGETASGWQEVALAFPVAVTAGTTYVVSYHSQSGDYVGAMNYFTQQYGTGSVHGLADGTDGPNGLFLYTGAPAFPTQSFQQANYYADVVFETGPPDTTPPTVTVRVPTPGASVVPSHATVRATFSEALDAGSVSGATFELRDSQSALVAASVTYDGGLHRATLTPLSPLLQLETYTATLRGGGTDPRIKDPSGNALAADVTWSFTVAGPTGGPFSVMPQAAPATPVANDGNALELGMKFRADVDGTVTGLRYYKAAGTTGVHTGNLWTVGGTNLAQQVFTGETASGWQELTLATPVAITAGTTYVVSYHSASGDYVSTLDYFTQQVGNNLVHGLADGQDGGNGLFRYTPTTGFPTQSFRSSNYYTDVVFYADVADVAAPTVTSHVPASGATSVPLLTAVTVTFSEQLDPSTVNGATIELRDALNTPVPASVTWNSLMLTATLTPSSGLAAVTSYTVTVRGGASAPRIQDASGNALAQDEVWSFTTSPPAAGPFTVFALSAPANPVSNDNNPIELGMKFRADVAGSITGLRYYKPVGATGVHTGNLWTAAGGNLASQVFTGESASGWQELTLATPVAIAAGTTYVVSYHSASGDYVSTANYFVSPAGAGLVHGLADGTDGPNGLFLYSATPAFPTGSFNKSNYYADVVFHPDGVPGISVHPAPVAACQSQPVTFSVTAVGGGLAYQWRKDGNDIGSATASSYAIAAAGAGDVGSYDCVVTNVGGSVTSNAAALSVSIAAAVDVAPVSVTVCAGGPATFTVAGLGTTPLGYQWRKNGNPIPGANGTVLAFAATVAGDSGSYDCVVSNGCGSATSLAATLTVDEAAAITANPASVQTCAGTGAAFSVTASGTAPIGYQWRKNGLPIGGANAATFSIAAVAAADAGSYDCEVSNLCGAATSLAATLTVDELAAITLHPVGASVFVGNSVSFAVGATGTVPLTFQWRKNGVPIGGATAATFAIASTALADAGSYDVVVSNLCNSITSSAASLTVSDAPSLDVQCHDLTTGPLRTALGDFSVGKGDDIVVIDETAGTVRVLENEDHGEFVVGPPLAVGAGPRGLAVADFDGDGLMDVAVACALGGSVQVLYGDGGGGFAAAVGVPLAAPTAVAAVAVLGHARPDLVVADGGTLWLVPNSANTVPLQRAFGSSSVLAVGTSFTAIGAGDVLGDAAPEIAATDSAGFVHLIGTATLLPASPPLGCFPGPLALTVAKLNGDLRADLAIAGSSGIVVLETPALVAAVADPTPSVAIATGRLDLDLNPDLAYVTALGTTVRFHGPPSPITPTSLDLLASPLGAVSLSVGACDPMGEPAGPRANTDELVVARTAGSVCVVRFRGYTELSPMVGTGCPGAGCVIGTTGGPPVVGNVGFGCTLDAAAPNAFALFLYQAHYPACEPIQQHPLGVCIHPFDLGMDLPALFAPTDFSGHAGVALGLPPHSYFIGWEFSLQWAVVDGGGDPVTGITLSQALLMRIGEY